MTSPPAPFTSTEAGATCKVGAQATRADSFCDMAKWRRARQLSLFGPDDAEHGASPLAVFDRPFPGIARVVMAPVPLKVLMAPVNRSTAATIPLRCAAVDASGWLLVAPTLAFDGSMQRIFARLVGVMDRVRATDAIEAAPCTGRPPTDWQPSVGMLSDPRHWPLHETHADLRRAVIGEWAEAVEGLDASRRELGAEAGNGQPESDALAASEVIPALFQDLQDAVEWLLQALHPEMHRAVAARPALAPGVARLLLRRAAHSTWPDALRNTRQALRNEPLPVLRWMTHQSCEAGDILSDAVLEGRSLPDTLADLTGRSRSVLHHASRHAAAIPDMATEDYRMLLQVVERLDVSRRPVTASQWEGLSRLVQVSRAHAQASERISNDILAACILEGSRHLPLGPRGDARVPRGSWHRRLELPERLDPRAVSATMLDAHALLTDCVIPLDPFRESVRPAPGESPVLWAAQAIASLQLDRLMRAWQHVMPAIDPVSAGCHVFELLAEPTALERYGNALQNCIADAPIALRYLMDGCVLVGVRNQQRQSVAMLSIRVSQCRDATSFSVIELAGPRNQPVGDDVQAAARAAVKVLSASSQAFGRVARLSRAMALCRRLGPRSSKWPAWGDPEVAFHA
jgi:hypothetical protein